MKPLHGAGLLLVLCQSAACAEEQPTDPLPGTTAEGSVLLSCLTAGGKRLHLEARGEQLHYSFGPDDAAPELRFSIPQDAAEAMPWQGVGRWEHYALELPWYDVLYHVYWSRDRLAQPPAIKAGVAMTAQEGHGVGEYCEPASIEQTLIDYTLAAQASAP